MKTSVCLVGASQYLLGEFRAGRTKLPPADTRVLVIGSCGRFLPGTGGPVKTGVLVFACNSCPFLTILHPGLEDPLRIWGFCLGRAMPCLSEHWG